MAVHNQIGKKGEQLAAEFLLQKGYEILDTNWNTEKAEIDIIAYLNKIIVFVEVKTRTNLDFGLPEDFVTKAKEKLLENAAQAYLEIMEHNGEIRFDIISVVFDHSGKATLNHIEDAFWPY
ncbi:YraN family protein [Pedobacter montanisoli]|uniref:UPF0102 protein MMF97_05585 n=1 Tax=Pedobacter montanisoli TaxID=2923277 RepID=A0ABS9ZV14_9SPHI|nr:YraN family protein [Pedobacter montanisoli]MCJ0742177.1 YraN family protein [Pedobacter montanisoli]